MSVPLSARPPLLSSVRWRLSAAISGVVLLCTTVCIAGAVLFLNHALTDRATADLRHTLQAVSSADGATGLLPEQRANLLGVAELVAGDPAVAVDVEQANLQALTLQLTPYFADLNSIDVLDVLDARGKVLVRMEDTAMRGDDLSAHAGVRAALAGSQTTAYDVDLPQREEAEGYALRAFTPLRNGSRIIGVVIAGRQLSSIFARQIGSALNAKVNLIVGNQRTGTNQIDNHGLPIAGVREPQEIVARIASGKPSIACMCSQGDPALSGLVPLLGNNGRPIGAVELISPIGSLYMLIEQLSFLLLALGATIVIAGTLLALGIGRRLTSRLLALEATAADVAEVAHTDAPLGDLQHAFTVRGEDEIASLARSFGVMMSALDDRLTANARLYAAAQAQVRELTGLAEIARLLTASSSLQETLDRLGEQVCRLVGCSSVAILLPSAGAGSPIYGGHGLPDNFAALTDQVLVAANEHGFEVAALAAIRTGQVVWQRLADTPQAYTALRANARRMGWGGATAVPLRLQDLTVGALTCFTTADTPLSDSDLSLLATIADQVAVAVENARLHAAARDLAALEERSRLARELHDSVTQALFSITLHARATQLGLQREGIDPRSSLARNLTQLNDLTQVALAEMRALIFELRPGALAEEGLTAALKKQVAALSAREGLAVDLQAPADRLPLDLNAEEQLYRLAQEALHNVVKHAAATQIWLRLEYTAADPGTLMLEVRDDGIGFDTEAIHPGHLGLNTMAERARNIGAHLEIRSKPGQGTVVLVTLAIEPIVEQPVPAWSRANSC